MYTVCEQGGISAYARFCELKEQAIITFRVDQQALLLTA